MGSYDGPVTRISSNDSEHVSRMSSNGGDRLGVGQQELGNDSYHSHSVLDDSGRSTVSSARPRFKPSLFQEEEEEPPSSSEEEEGEVDDNPPKYFRWGNILRWTPFRRYSRGSSIKMMERQYFIPPPEEGTTFFESLFYTWNGYGNDFVIWNFQASFFTVVSLLRCRKVPIHAPHNRLTFLLPSFYPFIRCSAGNVLYCILRTRTRIRRDIGGHGVSHWWKVWIGCV